MSAGNGGRGPAPKPPDQRARRNKDPIPLRMVVMEPTGQPELPAGIEWHPQTRRWWKTWAESPLSADFTETDWSELIDTAMVHTSFWNGAMDRAGELRLRAAKFGATPEDRARLRIQVVTAEEYEEKAQARKDNRRESRGRYSPPKAG